MPMKRRKKKAVHPRKESQGLPLIRLIKLVNLFI